MKILPTTFQDHLDGEVTTICNCWQIIRTDGAVLGFTDHDNNLSFEDTIFDAVTGFQSSASEENIEMSPDDQEIFGVLRSDKISEKDIDNNLYDGASIKHFAVNWQMSDERCLMRTLLIDEIKREDGVFRATLKSLVSKLDQTNVRRFQRVCSATLGDQNCGINIDELHKFSATVLKIDGNSIYVDTIGDKISGWFRFGRVTFLSGALNGQTFEVAEHFQHQGGEDWAILQLWPSQVQDLQVGDQLEVFSGCDKHFTTCKSKFQNQKNFRGFPHIPGAEFALSYASNSDEMDGGALIVDPQ